MKYVSKHQDLQICVLKLLKYLDVVGRGTETQLQVGENLNILVIT